VVSATAPLSSILADKAQPSTSSLPSIKQSQLELAQEGTRHTATVVDTTQNQSTATGNGKVMRTTMIDVQQAIEQLGHKDNVDGSRSFTFSSHEPSDCDTDAAVDGDDWRKSAGQKLAEKAKKVVEEQAARYAIDGRDTLRPPIDVEVSDDSGDEEDGDGSFGESSHNDHGRKHPHTPEEVNTAAPHQVDQKFAYSPSIQPSERYIVPSMVPLPESGIIEDSASETFITTATQPLFSQNEKARTSENHNSLLSPVLPGLRGISNRVTANHPSSAPLVFPSETQTLGLQEVVDIRSTPSPFFSDNGHDHASRSSVATSAFITNSSLFSASNISPRGADLVYKNSREIDLVEPNVAVEWTVEEVVDWLRAKGFDDTVCDKFIEQEVRGDVLLELHMEVLEEIGIVGYGTRIRIMNAILELRRISSVLSYEPPTHPGSLFRGSSPARQAHISTTSLSTIFGNPASPESSSDLGELAEQLSEPPHEGSESDGRSKETDNDVTVGPELRIPSSPSLESDQDRAAVRVLLSSME
jgi:SAM domain (Sterile alpha motif)